MPAPELFWDVNNKQLYSEYEFQENINKNSPEYASLIKLGVEKLLQISNPDELLLAFISPSRVGQFTGSIPNGVAKKIAIMSSYETQTYDKSLLGRIVLYYANSGWKIGRLNSLPTSESQTYEITTDAIMKTDTTTDENTPLVTIKSKYHPIVFSEKINMGSVHASSGKPTPHPNVGISNSPSTNSSSSGQGASSSNGQFIPNNSYEIQIIRDGGYRSLGKFVFIKTQNTSRGRNEGGIEHVFKRPNGEEYPVYVGHGNALASTGYTITPLPSGGGKKSKKSRRSTKKPRRKTKSNKSKRT